MTNWYKHFQTNINYDWTPKLTKFLTFTLMPICCIFFLYVSFYFARLSSRNKNDYQFIKGVITDARRIVFPTKGNQAQSFSIAITINDKVYSLHNSYLSNDNKVSSITKGKTADIYFDNLEKENEVTEIYIDGQEILTASETNTHFRELRNINLAFGLIFTGWFISRLYRYKKLGGLN